MNKSEKQTDRLELGLETSKNLPNINKNNTNLESENFQPFRKIMSLIDETKMILRSTLIDLTHRGQKLEHLANKSHELTNYSVEYREKVHLELIRKEKRNNCAFISIIGILLVFFYFWMVIFLFFIFYFF